MPRNTIIVLSLFILSFISLGSIGLYAEDMPWVSLEKLDQQDEWEKLEDGPSDTPEDSPAEVKESISDDSANEVVIQDEKAPSDLRDEENMQNEVEFRYSLIFDPLKIARESDAGTKTVDLQFESTITNKFSIVVIGLYSFLIPEYQEPDTEYNQYGFGAGIKFYPTGNMGSQSGLWVGPKATLQFGRYQYNTDTDYAAIIEDTTLIVGGEVGFKWFVGYDVGIVISPYVGYYYSTIQFPGDSYESALKHDYYFMGIHFGLGF